MLDGQIEVLEKKEASMERELETAEGMVKAIKADLAQIRQMKKSLVKLNDKFSAKQEVAASSEPPTVSE